MEHPFPRELSCCFTGHRPTKLPWGADESNPRCVELKKKLDDVLSALYESGIRHFLCGMALGCDTLFADAVVRLKALHTDVTLEAAIPCRDQTDRWRSDARNRYLALLEHCDMVTVLQETYTPGCMHERNRYMVNHASVLLAVYDGSPGGTGNTVHYAQKMGCEAILLQP